MINSWNVKTGYLKHLDNKSFDQATVRLMGTEVQKAICDLTKKVLETERGSCLATKAYREQGFLYSAIAFSNANGLCLILNNKEHRIATADEVYQGKVKVLDEIKKIHAILERQDFIPAAKTNDKAKGVFKGVMEQRRKDVEAPTLLNRTGVLNGDESSGIQKICTVATFWKVILFITGLTVMKTAFENMVTALIGENNLEKYFLSCANFLEGLTTLGVVVLSMMEKFSALGKNLIAKAAAGAAFPITAFILYGSVLLAAIYRLYVQVKFRFELNAMVGDGQDRKKLKEAMIWLKQQTQLSDLELKENAEGGLCTRLRNKWERFTLRVEEGVIDHPISPDRLDGIISSFEQFPNSKEAEAGARDMIQEIQRANLRAICWTVGSIFMNTIGIVATVAYLGSFGHISAGVIAALYLMAAVGALLTDSPKLRMEFFRWLREKCDCVKSADVSLEQGSVRSGTSSSSSD